MFLDAIGDTEHVGRDYRYLTPGLITRARQIRRSPIAGDSRFNLYSAVSAGCPRDVAAAIVVALSRGKR